MSGAVPMAYVRALRAFQYGARAGQAPNVRRHFRALERAGLIRCHATLGRVNLFKLTREGVRLTAREEEARS